MAASILPTASLNCTTGRAPGSWPHRFGEALILHVDRRDTGRLELLHGTTYVDRIAVTGIGIADKRNIHACRDAPGVIRDESKVDQSHVRPPEQACRNAVAGQVHRLETRLFDESGAIRVVDTGREDHRPLRETRP
jgi:hypothetical protein